MYDVKWDVEGWQEGGQEGVRRGSGGGGHDPVCVAIPGDVQRYNERINVLNFLNILAINSAIVYY